MLYKLLYKYILPILNFLTGQLHKLGLKPNHLTIIGFVINVVAAIFFSFGYFVIGSWIILIAGLFDMLDGALARQQNVTSPFGAFFDSVIDRYSDFIIFGGLIIYFAGDTDIFHCFLVLIVLSGALLTSYTKARAESLIACPACPGDAMGQAGGYAMVQARGDAMGQAGGGQAREECRVGLIERAERIVILAIGGIFHALIPALWVLSILTHLTAFQRIHFTWQKLKR